MINPIGLDHCLSFINCQLQPPSWKPVPNGERRRAITISRQTGAGGHTIAAKLAELLRDRSPQDPVPWTVFDRNLVEKVLADHHLPSRFAKFMAEDRISEMSDTMDELFGLHPSSWTLVHKVSETILNLAELGNVILIGRGASLITRKLNFVIHIRLVGSLERRIQNMQEQEQIDAKAARDLVRREDLARQRFLKKYFNRDIDDPLLYHMVINTDLVGHEEAARMIAEMVVPAGVPVEAGTA